MAWVTRQSDTNSLPMEDDWLENTDDPKNENKIDPIEELRRRMETLGQNEGLEKGLKTGEERGFVLGFKEEAPRALMLGRCLGAAKAVLVIMGKQQDSTLAIAIREAEQTAGTCWVSDPQLVDQKLAIVYGELAKLGINLPEWPQRA